MIIYYNFIKCIFGKIINFKLAYCDMGIQKNDNQIPKSGDRSQ